MQKENQKPKTLKQISFRHSSGIKELIEDICQAESIDLTPLMRQLVNTGLAERYNVKIIGNQVVDRGDVPNLTELSQAS